MFEISLVPDIKKEAIRAQKLRNWILFICIVVSGVAIGVVAILFGIKGGQDIAMTLQRNKMDTMSQKLTSFDNLDEFLTIQDELGNLSTIAENQLSASRLFEILGAAMPQNEDTVTLSEMTLSLEDSTLSIEGQANAGKDPMIDYRVLESFKKSLAMTTYDYGEYVDKNGNTIPAMCINEKDENGNALIENGSYYAIWYKGLKTCNPENPDEGALELDQRDTAEDEKIYRTPQFDKWYKEKKMTLDGTISNVPHFESRCKTYTGTELDKSVRWDTTNENCLVTQTGLTVSESSNGRDQNEQLVLRFVGDMVIEPEVFRTRNNFMMISGPTGQNVTDSYSQIESMFANRARDCASGDADCQAASSDGSSSDSSSGNGSQDTYKARRGSSDGE